MSEPNDALEEAARAYVAARLANEAAEPADWMQKLAALDGAWLALLDAFEQDPGTVRDAPQEREAMTPDRRAMNSAVSPQVPDPSTGPVPDRVLP